MGPLPCQPINTFARAFTYDFSNVGGAIGAYDTGIDIPVRAFTYMYLIRVSTAFASSGAAVITLGTNSANSAIILTQPYTYFTAGLNVSVPSYSKITTSGGSKINFYIAGAPLTAGLVNITLLWINSIVVE